MISQFTLYTHIQCHSHSELSLLGADLRSKSHLSWHPDLVDSLVLYPLGEAGTLEIVQVVNLEVMNLEVVNLDEASSSVV